jgi:RNA polymerase sigma factor (sigma-70 family)
MGHPVVFDVEGSPGSGLQELKVDTSLAPRAALEGVLLDREQRSRLVAYARARFGIDSDTAEDLLQETAIELLRLRTLVHSPRGFVFTVFHARCCRWVRNAQAERRMFSAGERDGSGPAATCEADPAELDARLLVQQALEEISDSCRKLLHAYYVEGRSLRESAETMALAYSGVWKTINRCLKKLRACLA